MTVRTEIRDLVSESDYDAAVRLQRGVWGDAAGDVVGLALLKVSQQMGGVAAGAFGPGGELLGLVYGITGTYAGEPAHWSHLLAVHPDARDAGLGRQLKQYQRTQMQEAGIGAMYWTFDPLVARNAHLNLNRLGVAIIDYVPHYYGEATSTTDIGIGTDRLIVRWDLESPAARDRAAPGVSRRAGVISLSTPDLVDTDVAFIEIPADVQSLKSAAPSEARAWRQLTRRAFQYYLGRRYSVVGFVADNGRPTSYRLERLGKAPLRS